MKIVEYLSFLNFLSFVTENIVVCSTKRNQSPHNSTRNYKLDDDTGTTQRLEKSASLRLCRTSSGISI